MTMGAVQLRLAGTIVCFLQAHASGVTVHPTGGGECAFTPSGTDYRGSLSRTKSGRACTPWADAWARLDPDAGIEPGSTYCRNPRGEVCHARASPWQYALYSPVRVVTRTRPIPPAARRHQARGVW